MNDELRKLIREQAEQARVEGRQLELAPELALRVLDALEAAAGKSEELAALTCGVRHYVRRNNIFIGECVAWNVLKKLVGVGESDEADDRRWEAYRQRGGTALRGYYKHEPRK